MLKRSEKVSFVVLALFFILVPLAFISTKTLVYPYVHLVTVFGAFKEIIARFITLFLLILLLLQFAFLKKPILKTPLYIPLSLILIYQACSLLWAQNKFQGFENWLHWGTLFAFFFVCLNTLKDTNAIKTIMKVALIPAFLICCISIICYTFQVDLPFFSNRVFKYSATFGNYKFAGEYLAPLVFWALGLWMSEKRKWQKRWHVFLTFFFIFSLFFIYKSRAALTGLILVSPLAFIFFMNRYKTFFNRKRVWAGLCAALIPFIFFIYFSFPSFKFQLKSGTIIQRAVIWKTTFKMIKERFWTGVGIGNFNLHYPFHASSNDFDLIAVEDYRNHFIRQTHNEYLQMFSELGLFGILLFAVAFFLVCKLTYGFLRKNKDPLTICLFLSFLCSCIIAVFVFNFQNTTASFFFIATITFLIKIITSSKKAFIVHTPPPKFFIAFLIFFLLYSAPKPLARQFFATYYQFQGKSSMAVHSLNAFTELQNSLKWNPNDWETLFLIGKAYGDHLLFPQAIAHLKKSLELNPSYERTFYNLGLFLEQNKDSDEAIHIYKRLLKFSPDFQKANLRLGFMALSQNQIEKAGAYFKKVLLASSYHKPLQVEAYQGLVQCHIRQGKYKKAAKEIFESFLLNPKIDESLFKYWLKIH